MSFETIIIIPSRIGSTRLPNKPLAQIGPLSLIEHVVVGLQAKFKDNIYIATDSEKIAKIINNYDAKVVMTDPECKTGSDRVYEALGKIPCNDQIKYVINVQGDMPFINPKIIEQIIERLKQNNCDIVTSMVKVDKEIAANESNVKVVFDNNWNALYFSRSMIPHGAEEFYYHVGIYGFHVSSLEQFIQLKQSKYETCEKLEQLRALENGMKIGVCLSNEIPISVDTPQDLEKAICYYKTRLK